MGPTATDENSYAMPKSTKQKGIPQTVVDEILKPDNRELVTAVTVFAVRQQQTCPDSANVMGTSGCGCRSAHGLGGIPLGGLEQDSSVCSKVTDNGVSSTGERGYRGLAVDKNIAA
jgi:hypothetical protein